MPQQAAAFDPDASWALHAQVAVRPEPFGALLYHFGTRKLSFLKSRAVVDVVRSLEHHESASAALRGHGLAGAAAQPYLAALRALADSAMIVRRGGAPANEEDS
ncbi:mycofactocin biosynthesis chaperone MftB [Rhodococcus rhodnii]|uniref:Mycofactocin system protein MftB n=2 Tax=Rhodococcus rhodnii TaxID=38312 RepID=R7WQA9_9NOCA|nr:mycofactocin biosynthesis chaperone MftB [Rhodococcus rhodnii]EOM77507.1 hypothetical protein Rrhod_1184 [Rhodococcus rhodnii LMG 5362]TXG90374.1 mycofactocin biosynthesis chaperone MftB [Rhodococcus rhodnii]